MTKKFYGVIDITSGRIVCSDPCYKSGEWCADSFPAKNGLYRVYIYHAENRNAILEIIHQDYDEKYVDWENADSACAVDSGTFGFFDYDYYAKYHTEELNEDWYDRNVCDVEGHWNADIDGKGVWCQSGYGDGSYDVDAVFEGKEVVALKVTFIYEDEDENEI